MPWRARALLDALLGRGVEHQPLHEDARRVHVVGVDLAVLDDLLHLGDRHPAAHRHTG